MTRHIAEAMSPDLIMASNAVLMMHPIVAIIRMRFLLRL